MRRSGGGRNIIIRVWVDLEVMAIKGYFTLPRALRLESLQLIQFGITLRKLFCNKGYNVNAGPITKKSVLNSVQVWHDGGHSFPWVWVWVKASQWILLSALAWNSHIGLAREISYEIGRRRGKARFQSNQQKRGISDSRGKVTVRERQLLKEELGLEDP